MPDAAQAAKTWIPRYGRRAFLRLAAGTAAGLWLSSCRRTPGPITPEPIPGGLVDTATFRRAPPWRLGRSSRGDVSSWMVMFSAHVEYGIQEAYRSQFSHFFSRAANWDANKQIEDIRILLSQPIDLLLIDPLNSSVVAQGLKEAMAAGVPVILASTRAGGAPFVSWVATDAEKRGAACAEWLSRTAPEGRPVILHSRWAAGETALWLRGVRQGLGQRSDSEPLVAECEWSVEGAQQAMSELLQGADPVGGVIAQGGVLGRGVVQAYLEEGSPIPPIAGVDDWNGWLRTAQQHKVRFLAQSGGANLGLRCVELATQVLSGETVPAFLDFPYQTFEQHDLLRYHRPELSDHYWAIHDLPEVWIERMFHL